MKPQLRLVKPVPRTDGERRRKRENAVMTAVAVMLGGTVALVVMGLYLWAIGGK